MFTVWTVATSEVFYHLPEAYHLVEARHRTRPRRKQTGAEDSSGTSGQGGTGRNTGALSKERTSAAVREDVVGLGSRMETRRLGFTYVPLSGRTGTTSRTGPDIRIRSQAGAGKCLHTPGTPQYRHCCCWFRRWCWCRNGRFAGASVLPSGCGGWVWPRPSTPPRLQPQECQWLSYRVSSSSVPCVF
jgi:hypothetical protein